MAKAILGGTMKRMANTWREAVKFSLAEFTPAALIATMIAAGIVAYGAAHMGAPQLPLSPLLLLAAVFFGVLVVGAIFGRFMPRL